MWWLLLLVPPALLLSCWLLGFCLGFLVWLTPTMPLKLKVARFFLARPYGCLDPVLGTLIGTEVDWLVRSKHGSPVEQMAYAKILQESQTPLIEHKA